MAIPEFNFPLEGEPGPVISEGVWKEDGVPFIDYSLFNEDGDIVYYTDFPRNVSPVEISQAVEHDGKELLINPPEDMVWDEVMELADLLIKEAERVPGL